MRYKTSPTYFLADFSEGQYALENLIKECFGSFLPDIAGKRHIKYLNQYISQSSLNVKTIVCERSYVDGDYLDDFSKYYVKCFSDYSTKCARLHLFEKSFDYENFDEVLHNKANIADVFGEYLGFIVIKPLPLTFIGKTCLKASKHLESSYKLLKSKQRTSLFGIQLEVEGVIFQEQDKVVAACATTAIWGVLHTLPEEHKTITASPSDITLSALGGLPLDINGFPNTGLNNSEIFRALEKYNLRVHEIFIDQNKANVFNEIFQTNVYGYINSNIPLILGAAVYANKEVLLNPEVTDFEDCRYGNQWDKLGDHAVNIVGIKTNNFGELIGVLISDDRIGPYIEYKISDNCTAYIDAIKNSKENFEVPSFCLVNLNNEDEVLIPSFLHAATYPKVRIGYKHIEQTVYMLYMLLKNMLDFPDDDSSQQELSEIKRLEKSKWDTKLYLSSTYKTELRKNRSFPNYMDILQLSMPKFIWVTHVESNNEDLFDIIFDATDLLQGHSFIECSIYDTNSFNVFKKYAEYLYQETKLDRNINDEHFLYPTLKLLHNKEFSYSNYLDRSFGIPKLPTKLKANEDGDEVSNDELQINKFPIYLNNSFDLNELDSFDKLVELSLNDRENKESKFIWIINESGSFVFGIDSDRAGHPTLTGGKAARVAGEIKVNPKDNKQLLFNYYSGRYSSKINQDKKKEYLKNAFLKLESIISSRGYEIELELPS